MSSKDSKTIGGSLEETKEYHTRYLRAVNNPLRRKILWALREGDVTVEVLSSKMGIDTTSLEWHLQILEHGFCVEREERNGKAFYKLTKEGKVVEYM